MLNFTLSFANILFFFVFYFKKKHFIFFLFFGISNNFYFFYIRYFLPKSSSWNHNRSSCLFFVYWRLLKIVCVFFSILQYNCNSKKIKKNFKLDPVTRHLFYSINKYNHAQYYAHTLETSCFKFMCSLPVCYSQKF